MEKWEKRKWALREEEVFIIRREKILTVVSYHSMSICLLSEEEKEEEEEALFEQKTSFRWVGQQLIKWHVFSDWQLIERRKDQEHRLIRNEFRCLEWHVHREVTNGAFLFYFLENDTTEKNWKLQTKNPQHKNENLWSTPVNTKKLIFRSWFIKLNSFKRSTVSWKVREYVTVG